MSTRDKANAWLKERFGNLRADANSYEIERHWSLEQIYDMLETMSEEAMDIRSELEEAGLTEKALAAEYDKEQTELEEHRKKAEQLLREREPQAFMSQKPKAKAKPRAKA